VENKNLRTFYTIILTQTLSLIGSRISGLALGIWVFNETGNATPLALVAFFYILPQVLLQSFAGVLADRWDRKRVMALSDAGQALGTLLLLALFSLGVFEVWHLYLITFIQSLFGVFQGPAFTASVTMLVPDEQRDRANAIMQMSNPAAGIIAPAIAGLVFAAIGVTGAIIIDLATFVLAVLVVMAVHIPRPRKTKEGEELSGTVGQELVSGLRYLWERPSLFWLLMMAMALNFIMNMSGVLMTPYLLARTGDEATYGFILSVFNAGMLIGAIIISVWGGTRPRMNTIIPSLFVTCTMVAVFGAAQSTWLLAVSAFLTLLPNAFANILLQSMLQAKVAPDVQGRVFGSVGQLAMLMTPAAYLIAGPLADSIFEPMVGKAGWEWVAPLVGDATGSGMGLIFVLSGTIALIMSIVLFSVPMIRNIESLLPDYKAQPAEEELVPEIATA
jgi:DHA3 family macrolide efflux protein-like MFS transporter